MKSLLLKTIVAGVFLAQQAAPDLILTNGKVITVDERFTIAQAIAIKGDRFVAVGSNQEITALAGPNTKRIDLRGRSVVPGMIDNHTQRISELNGMHKYRAAVLRGSRRRRRRISGFMLTWGSCPVLRHSFWRADFFISQCTSMPRSTKEKRLSVPRLPCLGCDPLLGCLGGEEILVFLVCAPSSW